MDIRYKSTKLKKALATAKGHQKQGPQRAKLLRLRLDLLQNAETLADLAPPNSPPARCHELNQGQRGKQRQLSVDLDHPYRLIFVPDHDPVPTLEDGGLDWSRVTAVKILSVEDTHG
jgi:proteic killer suppression protein